MMSIIAGFAWGYVWSAPPNREASAAHRARIGVIGTFQAASRRLPAGARPTSCLRGTGAGCVRARLQARLRRDRLHATWLPLHRRPSELLAQREEPSRAVALERPPVHHFVDSLLTAPARKNAPWARQRPSLDVHLIVHLEGNFALGRLRFCLSVRFFWRSRPDSNL